MSKRKRSRILYPTIFFTSACLLFWDQLRRLKGKVNKSCEPNAWTRKSQQPEYIYLEDPTGKDYSHLERGALATELFNVRQFCYYILGALQNNRLYEFVFSSKQHLAWRYLRLAQDDNYYNRQKAVYGLAHLSGLSDATCTQISQACDMRTAVGLARIDGTDLRLLLDCPLKTLEYQLILKRFHQFLIKLNESCPHHCLQYAIADIFAEPEDGGFGGEVQIIRQPQDVIPKCTGAILHHSWLRSNLKAIIEHGGLELLTALYRIIENDPSMSESITDISRILSNLSMYPESHVHLFQTGCIKVLAKLVRDENLIVSLPASRALQNCDVDSVPPSSGQIRPQFFRNIYCLHPIHRTASTNYAADIVFVHGLLGSVFITWRQRDLDSFKITKESNLYNIGRYNGKIAQLDITDMPTDTTVQHLPTIFQHFRKVVRQEPDGKRTQCWPREWLGHDCPHLRILGVNYDTNISNWAPTCPFIDSRLTLSDRGEHLTQVLLNAGVGARPVIWVTHSMGGLIVKSLLVNCAKSDDPLKKRISSNTKGVVFLSTPHRGSSLATLSPASRFIVWPTIEVQELRQHSAPLLKLHQDFLHLVDTNSITVLSFAERIPTFIKRLNLQLRLVEDSSSFTGVGELYGLPLDHLTICKPATRESFIYRKILHFIEQLLIESQEEIEK